MTQTPAETISLSRPEAIERIRRMIKNLTHDDECACTTTARYGITCQGQTRLSDADYRARYAWIARKRPNASRQELEQLVTLYHVGRQTATGAEICCDVETKDHCGCEGWNMFDNSTLEQFYAEMSGERIRIEPQAG